MDFGLTPADHIAIVAGIVVPAVGAIVAATIAIVRHVAAKSRALDGMIERVAALETDLAKERDAAIKTHRELYERLRHVDSAIAALDAKVSILIDRAPHV